MKSAVTTSLVSKRWRYIWTNLVHLDFEHPDFHLIRCPFPRPFDYKRDRYCKWVNKVMTGNRASHLSTFRIHFPLNGRRWNTAHIDKWIAMALSKNVSNLELNLSHDTGFCITNKYTYIIRQDVLSNNNGITTLKTIHLEALVVEGDVVEHVLSNCLNLDRLTVKNCEFYLCGSVWTFPKTQVVVASSKLKHLELYGCANIKSIQISAPNLTWFKFMGVDTKIQYTSVPALVNVTFEGGYWYHEHKLNVFSKFSNQLVQLSLSWSLQEKSLPTKFPSFPNVKQLEIYVMLSDNGKDNLLALIPFIKACPVLHTLKLKLLPIYGISWPAKFVQSDVEIETIRAHKHLSVVEFARFSGTESEANLALFLAEHAPMLNKFIFDPHQPQAGGNTHMHVEFANMILYEHISLWRRKAEDLAKRIRGGVDVVIL
ncbi:putative F-box/FBD/LRR-repeat protein At1g78840 [Chenopodium quinoa]|uniref:putative F-box/FBD/LRR-repeat protein At1g78840 n=1 Tax=Chenopodium quinoa TaxID=63459 RepID=UPI000B78D96A|nr:putative F-box/FBD/LRR-repeat protein At1g78840 [Chenopodium quinoa]